MTKIPDAALAKLHVRFGHVLSEYYGLAEALYEQELAKTAKAAPAEVRPRILPGVRMSLPTRGEVYAVGVGIVLQPPANSS